MVIGKETDPLTRHRLELEEGGLLHEMCCTLCDLGLLDVHLCKQQLQLQQGKGILALGETQKKHKEIL